MLNNVSSESKCNVEFTSGLSEEEYNKYIEAGKALHRNTYRGKEITRYYTDESLYTRISNGSFKDIYVGDYIIANEVTWLIADLDNYLYAGDQGNGLESHHATIIPAKPLMNAPMNLTDTAEGGYINSKMVTETLQNLISANGIIGKTFGSHILKYRSMLSKNINANAINQSGGIHSGSSKEWAWYTRKIDLMSEVNVFGETIWSSSEYDTGIDCRQYAIFQLKSECINSYKGNKRFNFWLKDVSASTRFADVGIQGLAFSGNLSGNRGVRARFFID